MPEFKTVPDAPGWWVKFNFKDGGIKDITGYDFFVVTDSGLVLLRAPQCMFDASEYYVWYGPIPSKLPEGWDK